MNILFCAGGTLGHINPSLSFIESLKKHQSSIRIIYITTHKEKDYQCLKDNPLINKIYYIESYGLNKNIFKIPKLIYKDLLAYNSIKKILKMEKIDKVIGMGGFISGIVICVANTLGIDTYIHEQNSIMGLSNKLVLNKVNKIYLTYKDDKLKTKHPTKVKVITNPRFIEARNKLTDNYIKNHILVTSGTNGSKFMNELVCKMINKYHLNNYTMTIITGYKYYDEVKRKINNINIYIKAFSNNLIDEIIRSDIIISRAGSSTLFEILGAKKKSIIIPSPNVTQNHQYHNAISFYKDGYIDMIEEKDLDIDTLYNHILSLSLEDNPSFINSNEYYDMDDITLDILDKEN